MWAVFMNLLFAVGRGIIFLRLRKFIRLFTVVALACGRGGKLYFTGNTDSDIL